MDLDLTTGNNTLAAESPAKVTIQEVLDMDYDSLRDYLTKMGVTDSDILGINNINKVCEALSEVKNKQCGFVSLAGYYEADTARILGDLCHSISLRLGGAECWYSTLPADKWLNIAEGAKIVVISSYDFHKRVVHSVAAMDKNCFEAFENAYNNGYDAAPYPNSRWKYATIRRLPIVMYNTLEPDTYVQYYQRENVSRFSGAKWFSNIQEKTVLIAGIGGIGSWTAMMLSRMQLKNIILYDPDVVEAANMSGQMYSKMNIGKPKVQALADTVYNYSEYSSVVEHQESFTENTSPCDIMVSGFDNMSARKSFFICWRKHVMSLPENERHKCLYVDGRLSAETLQVYCITGDDEMAMDEYSTNALFSSAEAEQTVCSYKQTTYMANMIGSVITNLITNFTANLATGAPVRTLPYFTEYEGALMKFNTIML